MRLFVSIDLPEEICHTLESRLPKMSGLRYTKADQLHLTLLFLGECDEGKIGIIKERLKGIDFEPFLLKIEGIGAFPNRKNPRVIWAGIVECEELYDLQRQVRNQLSEFADQKGNDSFKPHITLARVKKSFSSKDSDNLFKKREPLSVLIRSVSLKRSELSNKGSIHTVLEKIYAHE